MNVKCYRKCRKLVPKLKLFLVTSSNNLFGFRDSFYSYVDKGTEIKALDECHAIKRYLQRYYLENKERHKYHNNIRYYETTKEWGYFLVVNTEGFKKYYH